MAENAQLPDVPFSYANRHGIVVLGMIDGQAQVRCKENTDLGVISEIRKHLDMPLDLAFVSDEDFNQLLRNTYENAGGNAMQLVDGIEDDLDLSTLAEQVPQTADLLDSTDDAPIIRLINAILTEAVKAEASDVHIETFENRLVVRFRVDGVLQEVLQQSRNLAKPIVSRIKIMSKLDIAERRLPQDGRLSLKIAGHAVDVRVSTIPSGHGERVVLRLLDKQAGRLDLSSLGMSDETRSQIDELIH
ncbi:MAG: Flp pilus assembly complex ATPase component TadA, partial [Gammaproteobacteria bacterium]|nr:Flp pilus assembly complex ATPase component TadA [Gammaproteobacteria bacterium]